MDKFSKRWEQIEYIFMIVCGLCILILMTITIVDVCGRFFGEPLRGNVEISELVMVGIIMLAVGATQRIRGHVSMTAFVDILKRKKAPIYPILDSISLILTEIIIIIVFYYSFIDLLNSISITEKTVGPLYIIQSPARAALCIGLLLMIVRLFIQIWQSIPTIRKWGEVK